jgi:O-antigen/teichoic acid export membrane protein
MRSRPATLNPPKMLWQHGVLYLLARGVPGVISLFAIAVYTRLLAPEDYGHYALVIAGVGLANKLAFEWLRLGLLRFAPAMREQQDRLLATIAASFLGLVVSTAALGAVAFTLTDPQSRWLIAAGVSLLWVQALFDLQLERARSQLLPKRYGLMAMTRACLALAFGVLLVLVGFGALGLLLALMLGMVVALIRPLTVEARQLRLRLFDPALLASLSRYGGPLAVTAALSFIIGSSDRFLIGWLLSDAAVGRYAVAYDVTSASIGLLLMIVNLAAYPLVIRAFEDHGVERARQQLVASSTALLAIGVPAVVGLIVLARPLAGVLLGAEFQADAAVLIPLIAIAVLLRDLKAYYFDLAFHLGRNTTGQIWVTLAGAGVSIGLNLWLIPRYGLVGAASANISAYAVALMLSWILGRRVFALPRPSIDSLKIAAAAVVMGGVVWLLADATGAVALVVQVTAGAVVYAILMCILNVADARLHVMRLLGWRRQGTL